MSEHRVLFTANSVVIAHPMLCVLQELKKHNIEADIFVPDYGENHQFKHLVEDTVYCFNNSGFKVFRSIPKNMKYNIMYSAYPYDYNAIKELNDVKYRVRFSYCLTGGGVKEAVTPQSIYNYYDYGLSYGEPDVSILSAHCKTFPIGNIRLANYKRTRAPHSGKKTLLWLPTWGAGNRAASTNETTVNKIKELQVKYTVISKMHVAMAGFHDQQYLRDFVNMLDNVYDANTPVGDLLNQADVVLSDISSAAFDAIAADVPLALFGLGDDPVYLGGKLCLHQQLIEDGIVPGTNNIEELESVIEKALTPEIFARQQKLKKEMFPYEGRECVDAFMRFQDDLFNDRVDPWYIATRRAIRENCVRESEEREEMYKVELEKNRTIYETELGKSKKVYEEAIENTRVLYETEFENNIKTYKTELENKLDEMKRRYESSTSWKITKPLRAISRIVKRRKT